MNWSKRFFDILAALALAVILLPLIGLIALAILLADGKPVFYLSERMKTPRHGFGLVKFRTMRPAKTDTGVSGGDKGDRITRIGRYLRPSRLDELPQLWNVLAGDLSLVGPRPPLRQYVDAFPELYAAVLRSRPGVTGLASFVYHRHETYLLAGTSTAEETDKAYRARCIPVKAKIDLIYQRNRSLCFDVAILLRTLISVFRR
jgi:lipopolysaccharide/colanic/teichoic acid biosynthesis glycosyltransferase